MACPDAIPVAPVATQKTEPEVYMIPVKFTQASVECTIARLLAALAVGAIAGLVAPKVGAHFDFLVSQLMQTGIGAAAALLTWFASRRLFDFTEDCMEVPTMSPAFQKAPDNRPVHALRPAADKSKDACRTCVGAARLEQQPQEDGSIRVVVTTTGLTKREFNTLRARLEQVRGITWQNPKNLGEGKRQIEGVAPASPSRPESLKRLEELTGQRV